jgi:hypothetical protein
MLLNQLQASHLQNPTEMYKRAQLIISGFLTFIKFSEY